MNENIVTLKDKVFYSINENNKYLKNKEFKDEITLFEMMKKVQSLIS